MKIEYEKVFTATYIISFEIKMRKVDGDSGLRRCDNFPSTVFITRVQIRETGRRQCPILLLYNSSTRILALSTIRVELKPKLAAARV